MSVERIKSLLELMRAHDLAELELEEGEFKVKLRKHFAVQQAVPMAAPAPVAPGAAPAGMLPPSAAITAIAPLAPPADADAGLIPIKSPIVGTFYRASSPDAEPFVSEGTAVKKDTVTCIIDAMKIMNEIKSGVTGTIVKVLVENGEPVEYDQPLFLVKP